MTTVSRRNPLGFIEAEIDDLKAKHLYRPLRVMSAAQGPMTVVDGREVISLSSNDYLGLTHHPRLRDKAMAALGEFGVGSGAVRTIAGTMTAPRSMRWAPTTGTKRALVRLPTVRNATWKAKNRP